MLDTLLHLSQAARDAAYDNTRAVSDSALQLAEFEARSAALVKRCSADLDVPYGDKERQKLDFFHGSKGAATLLFIHGGYWQMRHKNTFRFVAEGALQHGLNVALIGYTLAPHATLSEIVQEVHQGIAAVRAHAHKQGAADRVLLSGWSAGGHLTAMGLQAPGVVAGLGISGIYDLGPIAHTYLNAALHLSDADIASLSPLRQPVCDKPFVTAFGSVELMQLQAQSQAFAQHRMHCINDVLLSVEGADHFSILNALARSDGVLLQALRQHA
ncbi:alpha/beta hydrolase [Comamonas sp. NoAH]|uniref:alpha/beta hydrolase n=1 Tax=Comamonas halotolerans TaxID=3041496 RepID=UPI0024E07030|nr:alpha/beta hydrolase [Comamonas sp. NoAH]